MLKGVASDPYEFKIYRKDGEIRWILESASSVLFKERKATFGNFMDITDRHQSDQALRQSEALYRAIVHQASDVIYLIDIKTKQIVEANPAFHELLGYSPDKLKQLSLYDYIAHDRQDIDFYTENIIKQKEHFLGERTHRCENGQFLVMEVSGNLIHYSGRDVICVVARDISKRKIAEQQNKLLTQQLIKVGEEERKLLASDLHDELGQTLTALRFSLDNLWNSIKEADDVQKKKCSASIKLVERISRSTRRFLYQLRPPMLDDLGLIPTLEWYIANDIKITQEIKISFHSIGFKKRIDIELEIVLFRVFQECMNNILKHAKASNVEITLTYSYPKVIFVIKDDGVGFNTSSISSPSLCVNPGIGLLGMRERVSSIGGDIQIRSAPGAGTVVRLTLEDQNNSRL